VLWCQVQLGLLIILIFEFFPIRSVIWLSLDSHYYQRERKKSTVNWNPTVYFCIPWKTFDAIHMQDADTLRGRPVRCMYTDQETGFPRFSVLLQRARARARTHTHTRRWGKAVDNHSSEISSFKYLVNSYLEVFHAFLPLRARDVTSSDWRQLPVLSFPFILHQSSCHQRCDRLFI
jgi:hypothetical protein